eukprot:617748-Pleurochrysis_carterae.AAC.2
MASKRALSPLRRMAKAHLERSIALPGGAQTDFKRLAKDMVLVTQAERRRLAFHPYRLDLESLRADTVPGVSKIKAYCDFQNDLALLHSAQQEHRALSHITCLSKISAKAYALVSARPSAALPELRNPYGARAHLGVQNDSCVVHILGFAVPSQRIPIAALNSPLCAAAQYFTFKVDVPQQLQPRAAEGALGRLRARVCERRRHRAPRDEWRRDGAKRGPGVPSEVWEFWLVSFARA